MSSQLPPFPFFSYRSNTSPKNLKILVNYHVLIINHSVVSFSSPATRGSSFHEADQITNVGGSVTRCELLQVKAFEMY